MTERQADQKWVDDTRAEYLRRTEPEHDGLLAFALALLLRPERESV